MPFPFHVPPQTKDRQLFCFDFPFLFVILLSAHWLSSHYLICGQKCCTTQSYYSLSKHPMEGVNLKNAGTNEYFALANMELWKLYILFFPDTSSKICEL